ncbi:ribosomal-protein-alanine N-acetyltransferase [Bacilli bacterium PM5-3]|nr:ribosomal-protein-alanine N-acetyltransferase [Bacilli bacterium PM5-3]MDH6603842.1 ribosomal-protein-alanine N-acetyltransferase [Bacilli bacterium PM5-9]
MVFETKRLKVEKAVQADIEKIIEIESHPDNRDFLWIGTFEEHCAEINDPLQMLMVIKEKSSDEIVGYLLARINEKSNSYELRRIAITIKQKGYGKETMQGLFAYVFKNLKLNKIWLDVYPDNNVGIALYEKLGMHRDGVLRESDLCDRGYIDQIIYSLLRNEYI